MKQASSNKTAAIFMFAIAEGNTGVSFNGLSDKSTDRLVGCASEDAKTEAEFLEKVQTCAIVFNECIDHVITDIKSDIAAADDDVKTKMKADLVILREMKSWTFDEKELEALARMDWAEYHPA